MRHRGFNPLTGGCAEDSITDRRLTIETPYAPNWNGWPPPHLRSFAAPPWFPPRR